VNRGFEILVLAQDLLRAGVRTCPARVGVTPDADRSSSLTLSSFSSTASCWLSAGCAMPAAAAARVMLPLSTICTK